MTVLPQRGIASTHGWDVVTMMQARYERAVAGHEAWAREAKRNFEFMEGDQWPLAIKHMLEAAGRPALTFNEIGPLVRLILGFFAQNRTMFEVVPETWANGIEDTAEALTHLMKVIDNSNDQEFTDLETFLHGIVGGRGYQDTRLSFDDNDQGEIVTRDQDPFSTFIDPDAEAYDLNEHNYVITSRMISLDEAEIMFGVDLAYTLAAAMGAKWGPLHGRNTFMTEDEVAPWRGFGGGEADKNTLAFAQGLEEHYDRHRKTVRLLDMQHHVRVRRPHFIDVATGDRIAVPEGWDRDRVKQTINWYAAQGHELLVQSRLDRRVKWTIMCGDIICYDEWSPYDRFTINGFFPYFRRGRTRGMVSDLIDPQMEKNKRRSAEIDIVTRTAHAGWMYPEGALDPEQEENLDRYGAVPGIVVKYRSADEKPEQLKPVTPPTAMERLEQKASEDMRRISGINESALGEVDKVQSGRAIENRQRQSVIGIQLYMDNFNRFKKLTGKSRLALIQRFYTEKRLVRLRGAGGENIMRTINEPTPDGRIVNDVTLGKFAIEIDTTPAAKSFMEDQFNQIMQMVERGLIPPEAADLVIEMSSLPNKDQFKERIRMVLMAKGLPIPPDESALPQDLAPQPGPDMSEISTDVVAQLLQMRGGRAA